MKNSLLLAVSYSGNTEETIDFLEKGIAQGHACAVIAKGGRLLEIAQERKLPYIQLPDTGIQPRMALGFLTTAIATFLGDGNMLEELHMMHEALDALELEDQGRELARSLHGKVPVVYASLDNLSLAYNWKIKFNETGKIPAFYNVFPELNHNEMTGFDVTNSTRSLSAPFHFVFLKDDNDDPRIIKRMEITESAYEERGIGVTSIDIGGNSILERAFRTLILGDWVAFFLAERYGVEAEQVPMVEDFKQKLKG